MRDPARGPGEGTRREGPRARDWQPRSPTPRRRFSPSAASPRSGWASRADGLLQATLPLVPTGTLHRAFVHREARRIGSGRCRTTRRRRGTRLRAGGPAARAARLVRCRDAATTAECSPSQRGRSAYLGLGASRRRARWWLAVDRLLPDRCPASDAEERAIRRALRRASAVPGGQAGPCTPPSTLSDSTSPGASTSAPAWRFLDARHGAPRASAPTRIKRWHNGSGLSPASTPTLRRDQPDRYASRTGLNRDPRVPGPARTPLTPASPSSRTAPRQCKLLPPRYSTRGPAATGGRSRSTTAPGDRGAVQPPRTLKYKDKRGRLHSMPAALLQLMDHLERVVPTDTGRGLAGALRRRRGRDPQTNSA